MKIMPPRLALLDGFAKFLSFDLVKNTTSFILFQIDCNYFVRDFMNKFAHTWHLPPVTAHCIFLNEGSQSPFI
jgi:hypothetical protein